MQVYTVDEVAQILKLSAMTIREHLRQGKLKGAKIGKHWRLTEEQLKAYLDRSTNN